MLETLPKFPRISGIDEKVFAKALESLGVDWDRTLDNQFVALKSDFLASRIIYFIRMISNYKSNKVTKIKFK
jgi:hypothetical protein